MKSFYLLVLLSVFICLQATKITIDVNDQSSKTARRSGNARVTSIDNSHTRTKIASSGNSISNMISSDNLKDVEKKEKVYNYFRKAEAVPYTNVKSESGKTTRSMW